MQPKTEPLQYLKISHTKIRDVCKVYMGLPKLTCDRRWVHELYIKASVNVCDRWQRWLYKLYINQSVRVWQMVKVTVQTVHKPKCMCVTDDKGDCTNCTSTQVYVCDRWWRWLYNLYINPSVCVWQMTKVTVQPVHTICMTNQKYIHVWKMYVRKYRHAHTNILCTAVAILWSLCSHGGLTNSR